MTSAPPSVPSSVKKDVGGPRAYDGLDTLADLPPLHGGAARAAALEGGIAPPSAAASGADGPSAAAGKAAKGAAGGVKADTLSVSCRADALMPFGCGPRSCLGQRLAQVSECVTYPKGGCISGDRGSCGLYREQAWVMSISAVSCRQGAVCLHLST
jgi:hypothetical protein